MKFLLPPMTPRDLLPPTWAIGVAQVLIVGIVVVAVSLRATVAIPVEAATVLVVAPASSILLGPNEHHQLAEFTQSFETFKHPEFDFFRQLTIDLEALSLALESREPFAVTTPGAENRRVQYVVVGSTENQFKLVSRLCRSQQAIRFYDFSWVKGENLLTRHLTFSVVFLRKSNHQH